MTPVTCTRRQLLRASTRSLRASMTSTSASRASSIAEGSGTTTRLRCPSSARAGKTVAAPWAQAQEFDSSLLNRTGKKIDTRNTTFQAINSVNQSLGQMANTSVQVRQGEVQANAKEDEVDASIAQSRKQIVDEQLSYNSNSMKELIQTLHELSQNYVAAWRAAAAVV